MRQVPFQRGDKTVSRRAQICLPPNESNPFKVKLTIVEGVSRAASKDKSELSLVDCYQPYCSEAAWKDLLRKVGNKKIETGFRRYLSGLLERAEMEDVGDMIDIDRVQGIGGSLPRIHARLRVEKTIVNKVVGLSGQLSDTFEGLRWSFDRYKTNWDVAYNNDWQKTPPAVSQAGGP